MGIRLPSLNNGFNPYPKAILAPFRFFGRGHPHPHHRQSLLRYLFPHPVRDRYRERLLDFHLDTLPRLKHRLQSRIYRYLLERQAKRTEKRRVVDLVRRHGRRLLGPQYLRRKQQQQQQQQQQLERQQTAAARHGSVLRGNRAHRMPTTGGPSTGYGAAANTNDGGSKPGEKGYRRMKLAAMAGNLYRSGQQAVTDIREQYAQTRVGLEGGSDGHGRPHIPGAFPDVAISVRGKEQMMLFPCYAKRHVKRDWSEAELQDAQQQPEGVQGGQGEEYWRTQWERHQDERALVDVDVRGWIYNPQDGPMTRRNRMLLGLARQLSGLTAPKADAQNGDPLSRPNQTQADNGEDRREQQRIEQEAAHIERQGQREKRVAYTGGYSEVPQKGTDPEKGSIPAYQERRGSGVSSWPPSPTQTATQYSTNAPTEMTEAELLLANANLMARIAPFMTNPLVALPVTIFFYNDKSSQSRTILTNEAGHFITRAALDFVPTHVRVLADEDLSAIQEIKITEPYGVSLISDVDDTVKKSNISSGAREIFRNTFVRDLSELTVEGVKDWYSEMHKLGVSIHYCSNSPWQLYPVLASFFKLVGLPAGSLHLKQYTGMLQGIFEPVAERKKSTLDRLMRDFPNRKFLLVGDSGEADLEVYTELALANPGRILAIFIRDVTTPEVTDFFNHSFNGLPSQMSNATLSEEPQSLAGVAKARTANQIPTQTGPVMGDLIDISDDTKPARPTVGREPSNLELLAARKPAPPRPVKPAALRSKSSLADMKDKPPSDGEQRPPLPARKTAGNQHPLAQVRNVSSPGSGTPSPDPVRRAPAPTPAPQPPPPRRRGTPSSFRNLSPKFTQARQSNSDIDFEPLPPSVIPPPMSTISRSTTRSPNISPNGSPQMGPQSTINKKLDLWRRRVARAHEQLEQLGVVLYTWRKGQDVVEEALAIVKRANREMERTHGQLRPLKQEQRREQQHGQRRT